MGKLASSGNYLSPDAAHMPILGEFWGGCVASQQSHFALKGENTLPQPGSPPAMSISEQHVSGHDGGVYSCPRL